MTSPSVSSTKFYTSWNLRNPRGCGGWLLKFSAFWAAFLLFQIELITAKILLPYYGGGYLVWAGCVAFFQAVLLAGYFYAYRAIERWGIDRYRIFHVLLMLLPFLGFPTRQLTTTIHPHGQVPLAADIFWQLLTSVGPVFFVLSTFSIILQEWMARSHLSGHDRPYVIYAASNWGSLAALLSYPFFFEFQFDVIAQLNIWRAGYLFLLILQIFTLRLIPIKTFSTPGVEKVKPMKSAREGRWFVLGAGASVLFLAFTNLITAEIAPIPLLWVIPLAIYLFSFAVNFSQRPWFPSWIKEKFHLILAFSILFYFILQKEFIPFAIELIFSWILLFLLCMYTQHELYELKPEDKKDLPYFYLIISAGSFTGGILVSWIMPLISKSFLEYFAGPILISFSSVLGRRQDRISVYDVRLLVYLIVILTIWPILFTRYNIFGFVVLFFLFHLLFKEFKGRPAALHYSLIAVLIFTPLLDQVWSKFFFIARHRNYYGLYKICDVHGIRFLMNGTTIHGGQYLDARKNRVPLTYYHPRTPVGEILRSDVFSLTRVGVMGLGAGSLAAFVSKNQVMDFYEIDPDVYSLAQKYFSYLKQARGRVNVILGDARVALAQRSAKDYDILIADAFSGDAMPFHLVTTDALKQYRKAVSPRGIVLFHISNRYIDLLPVLVTNAHAIQGFSCFKNNAAPDPGRALLGSTWVAVTWDKDQLKKLVSRLKWYPVQPSQLVRPVRPWSDRYWNVLPAIKIKSLINQIRSFRIFDW